MALTAAASSQYQRESMWLPIYGYSN